MSINKKQFNIYGLRLTGTFDIKYIGFTCEKLSTRLSGHYHQKSNIKKKGWLNENRNNIDIFYIDGPFPECEINSKEVYWIAFYKAQGYILLNKTKGGAGTFGCKQSEETISKRVNHPNSPKNNPEVMRKVYAHPNSIKNREELKNYASYPHHPSNNPEVMAKIMVSPGYTKNDKEVIKRIMANPGHQESIKIQSKKVVQCDLKGNPIQYFSGMKRAAIFHGHKTNGTISKVVNGRTNTAYGFKWVYYNENIHKDIPFIEVQMKH